MIFILWREMSCLRVFDEDSHAAGLPSQERDLESKILPTLSLLVDHGLIHFDFGDPHRDPV